MFINNLTGKTIKDISFDGFWFSIPAGVSLCWDSFGEHLFKNAYPETGSGVPPVTRATASQWKGDRYVDVRRFELNSALVPNRADLIKLAKKRGVDAATIELWREDETIDGKEMARVINELDVPDHIKYPVPGAEVADAYWLLLDRPARLVTLEKEALKELDLPTHVDQKLLDENPVLGENGVKVGDPISVADTVTAKEMEAKKAAAAKAGAAPTAPTTAGKPKAAAKKTVVAKSVPKTAAPKAPAPPTEPAK